MAELDGEIDVSLSEVWNSIPNAGAFLTSRTVRRRFRATLTQPYYDIILLRHLLTRY